MLKLKLRVTNSSQDNDGKADDLSPAADATADAAVKTVKAELVTKQTRWQSGIAFAAYTTTMFKQNWRNHSQIALNCVLRIVGGCFCFTLVPITLFTAVISTCIDGRRYVRNKSTAGLTAKRIAATTVANEENKHDIVSS